MDEDATIQCVKNKIDSIRECRKELKKIRESRRPGMAEEEEYEPNLWYFDNIFLVDQETPPESISSLDTPIKNIVESEVFISDDTLISPPLFSGETDEESASVIASTSRSAPISSITFSSSKSGTKRKRDKPDELLEKISKTVDNKDDKFDMIGKNYANKLRDMLFYERNNQLQ
ncbi:hypothetical protein HHI36_001569 [Cryptolaemus montrouzieri]|uniref:MADF domain-containing protein n=1 Tax=Cryptolaemus montrouzieri TaxID=559131 RepID=A0ABD2P868_9CUCU